MIRPGWSVFPNDSNTCDSRIWGIDLKLSPPSPTYWILLPIAPAGGQLVPCSTVQARGVSSVELWSGSVCSSCEKQGQDRRGRVRVSAPANAWPKEPAKRGGCPGTVGHEHPQPARRRRTQRQRDETIPLSEAGGKRCAGTRDDAFLLIYR